MKEKYCKVCGASSNNTRIINSYCRKHYLQLYRHGEIKRSIYDKNEIEVIGNIANMKLYDTKGNVTGITQFNSKHIPKIVNIKWYQKNGYVRGTTKTKKVFLHRVIMEVIDNEYIDHIDNNPLNNLDNNLRICTHEENTRNRKYVTSKEHVGVAKTPSGKWKATITHKYKSIHLGTFNTFEEAKKVRLQAEEKYFKDFAPSS